MQQGRTGTGGEASGKRSGRPTTMMSGSSGAIPEAWQKLWMTGMSTTPTAPLFMTWVRATAAKPMNRANVMEELAEERRQQLHEKVRDAAARGRHGDGQGLYEGQQQQRCPR